MDIPDLTPGLEPLVNSWSADDIELELKQQFIDLFQANLRSDERDLNVYGAPHLGSIDLIEKFVKRDGLALIRTDDASMGYLYRAWRARNPKRGLFFLRTYLQLLWPNGWTVDQQWQDKSQAYPTKLVSRAVITDVDPHTSHYLTSRLRIAIDDENESGVNIPTVAPALRSVIAAKFVLQIISLKRFANTGDSSLGLSNGISSQAFSDFCGDAVIPQCSNSIGLSNGLSSQCFADFAGAAIVL